MQHFDGHREEVDDVVEEVEADGNPTGGRKVTAKVVKAPEEEKPKGNSEAETK